MKKMMMLAAISLTFTMNAFAALPPFYESLIEISSILKDQQLAEKLSSGEPIVEIKKNDQGFLITTSQHKLQVNVVYEKQNMPGPAKFTLQFQNPEALDGNQ